MRIAVLIGGRSSEHEISRQSGASVANGLREAGHEVVPVLLERDGRWTHEGEEGWREHVAAMGIPVWVKPARLGSSVGITKVTSPERPLEEAIDAARGYDPRVIIEANGGGREVECSVMGNDDPVTSPPGEIVAHADWYDFEAKYSEGGMDLIVPARIGDDAIAG